MVVQSLPLAPPCRVASLHVGAQPMGCMPSKDSLSTVCDVVELAYALQSTFLFKPWCPPPWVRPHVKCIRHPHSRPPCSLLCSLMAGALDDAPSCCMLLEVVDLALKPVTEQDYTGEGLGYFISVSVPGRECEAGASQRFPVPALLLHASPRMCGFQGADGGRPLHK